MPLYDYRCSAGHKYEVRLPFGSPSEQPCEKCGKPAQRQLHARPIMFKGSGWYSTDSRGSSTTRTSRSSFTDDGNGNGSNGSTSTTTTEPAKAEKRAEKAKDLSTKADAD